MALDSGLRIDAVGSLMIENVELNNNVANIKLKTLILFQLLRPILRRRRGNVTEPRLILFYRKHTHLHRTAQPI
jgi:hypothetical protein